MLDGFRFQVSQYTDTPIDLLESLYTLRKEIFADRLNWKVRVNNSFESDEYDHPGTTYITGSWNSVPLAGVRLINTLASYMVEGPFRSFFDCPIPKSVGMAESSRFFVDTARARSLGIQDAPLTEMLLFSMHNHAAAVGLDAIITVVSKAMARIVRRSGWEYRVLSIGEASPGETVLLLDMPVTADNRQRLLESIALKQDVTEELLRWPVKLVAPGLVRPGVESAA